MSPPDPSPRPTWWILAGLSVEEWTPAEERWLAIERRRLRASLPRSPRSRLHGIVVDWESPDDVRLLKTIRPGDLLVTVARQAPHRWVVEPPALVLGKDTYWWPSMRRTTMLTVVRPPSAIATPLAQVVRSLAAAGVTLPRGGTVSHPLTSKRAIAALSATLGSPRP